jgi:hypothetical protein
MHNTAEERRSNQHGGGSLKSVLRFVKKSVLGLRDTENEGATILRNVGDYPIVDTAFCPKRFEPSTTPL